MHTLVVDSVPGHCSCHTSSSQLPLNILNKKRKTSVEAEKHHMLQDASDQVTSMMHLAEHVKKVSI